MSAELIHKHLSNLVDRIETLERNALEEAEYQDRKYELLVSEVDDCRDQMEIFQFDFERWVDLVEEDRSDELGTLKRSVEKLITRQNTLEKNHTKMMQRYEDFVKELHEEAERIKRQVMRKEEVEYGEIKEEIRKLKDELRSNRCLTEQPKEKIRTYETSGENEENLRNNSEKMEANGGVQIVEPSSSESKRNDKRPDVPPPTPTPGMQKRRAKKKKSSMPDDDAVVDIKPTGRYNLRNRNPRR